MESRGHKFTRYAEDFIVMVNGANAAKRVLFIGARGGGFVCGLSVLLGLIKLRIDFKKAG